MPADLSIATIVATVIALFSMIGAVAAAFYTRRNALIVNKTRADDHERSRQSQAIEMMKFWFNSSYGASVDAHRNLSKLVSILDPRTCEAIEQQNAFTISVADQDIYRAVLVDEISVKHDSPQRIEIRAEQSAMLRTYLTKNANLLEIVASAYMNNVADRQMIEQEFMHVFFKNEQFSIGNFINATSRYPSLKALRLIFQQKKLDQAAHDKIT
jgi:Fe-S cluster biosynthesis and repair protein YggX